jgi:hypothetical protein
MVSQNSFLLFLWGAAITSCLSTQLDIFFRQHWVEPQLILDHNKYLIVFKFVVASKNVGFHIYKLPSSCDQYKIFFNLWSIGGAHWKSGLDKYDREQEEQWTTIHGGNVKKSYASVVRNHHRLTGANRVPMGARNFPQLNVNLNPPVHRSSIFDRIIWPKKSPAAQSDPPRHPEAAQQSNFENLDQRRNGRNLHEGEFHNSKDKGK